MVFTNANVITISDAAHRAEAVAITDDVITAVGDRAAVDALIGDKTRVIHLDNATVIPGLVDAHSHFFGDGVGLRPGPGRGGGLAGDGQARRSRRLES